MGFISEGAAVDLPRTPLTNNCAPLQAAIAAALTDAAAIELDFDDRLSFYLFDHNLISQRAAY